MILQTLQILIWIILIQKRLKLATCSECWNQRFKRFSCIWNHSVEFHIIQSNFNRTPWYKTHYFIKVYLSPMKYHLNKYQMKRGYIWNSVEISETSKPTHNLLKQFLKWNSFVCWTDLTYSWIFMIYFNLELVASDIDMKHGLQRCWWQVDVRDFISVTIFVC